MAKHEEGKATSTSKRKAGQPDKLVSEAIGAQLRQMYDSVLREPVPDELAELVAKLSKPSDRDG